jgi:2,3-bisphosphoglycerate-dependent phosphoglycerate mutase
VILLARHGETDDNAEGRVQGSLDPGLNERGREQAGELARAVAGDGIVALWTSDLRRAVETAALVGSELGLEPRPDPRLRESDRGRWQGRLVAEIEAADPELWAAWRRGGADFRFPGGESLGEHLERVSAVLDDVAAASLPALVVSHGGTIRCALARRHPRGLDAFHETPVPNGAVFRIDA